MAPRKAASPAKPRRVTRAQASEPESTITIAEPPKRRTTTKPSVPSTTAVKKAEVKSRVTKKSTTAAPTTKTSQTTARSSRTKRAALTEELESVHEQDEQDDDELAPSNDVTVQVTSTTRAGSRTSRAQPTNVVSALASAPRRRIKVTPLDAANHEPVAVHEPEVKEEKKSSSTKSKKEKPSGTKSTASSRSKRSAVKAMSNDPSDETAETEVAEPLPKKRGRGRTGTIEKEVSEPQSEVPVPKTRGRPKKEKSTEASTEISDPVVSTRQTRARAASTASATSIGPTITVAIPRKKVTFQDLPDEEDEKENIRPVTKAAKKASNTSTKKTDTSVKGMKAKPIRKPASTSAAKSVRGRAASKVVEEDKTVVNEMSEKIQHRALTPKKITQVAKASFSDTEDEEDELAGAKTPVRDLSMSPKRGIIGSAMRTTSPVKKLDFTPALNAHPKSPERINNVGLGAMLSPARRNPFSPAKEMFDQSPRRAPEGVTVFRAQLPDLNNPSVTLFNASKTQSLLQSPKRGLADASIFPASAAKLSKSPFKASLLSSPARRLFSPSKQKTPARNSPSPTKKATTTPLSEASIKSSGDLDIEVTSHFRPSMSPHRSARVYTMSDDELAQENAGFLDFDQSVLNVRSPLKVDKVKAVVELPVAEKADPVGSDEEVAQVEESMEERSQLADWAEADPAPAQVDVDETLADPDVQEEQEHDDTIMEDVASEKESSPISEREESFVKLADISRPTPRLSNALFNRLRDVDDEESSEDELAAEHTPDHRINRPTFRSSLNQSMIRSRLSSAIAPPSAARNMGFTPLATQMRGWTASSPEKRVRASDIAAQSRGLFSPVARVHVEGSVELTRQETPGRSAKKRKSMVSRLSYGPSVVESPANPDFFADGMTAQEYDENNENSDVEEVYHHEDLHSLIPDPEVQADVISQLANESKELSEARDEDSDFDETEHTPGEITTDLIKFTNASDTAMVDFAALADEAEQLAHDQTHDAANDPVHDRAEVTEIADSAPGLDTVEEEQSMLSTSSDQIYGDENAPILQEETAAEEPEIEVEEDEAGEEMSTEPTVLINRQQPESPIGEIASASEQEERHPADVEESVESSNYEPAAEMDDIIESIDFNVTPIRPDPNLQRFANTVVSKVPLRPEGDIPAESPIKISRKRARSLSAAPSKFSKRRSLGDTNDALASISGLLATPDAKGEVFSSPQRRVRSAAPSPAQSLYSTVTTPGQTSFAVDDFGDSTLDGIELPSDEFMSDDVEEEEVDQRPVQDDTLITIGSTFFKTPIASTKRRSMIPSSANSNEAATTPRYAMSTKSSKSLTDATPVPTLSKAGDSSAKTPVTTTKNKTPGTLVKGKTPAKTPLASRTPLKPVNDGVLSGAIVHVDVHTSEGADASGIFVELLTTMGARCVREWKWNPRASLAPAATSAGAEASTNSDAPIGITHVVYKDGGKRTLEKVRSANGQVFCIGVQWVLDCEREGKWLDEADYAVDTGILPRGGSRRRKSMEPRMLVNMNGSLSAKKDARRSVSAEYIGLTPEMKFDLVNTPIRGREELVVRENEQEIGNEGDDTEISSTYNSPTAATIGGAGDTADIGALLSRNEVNNEEHEDQDGATTLSSLNPSPAFRQYQNQISTPPSTSLTVDYDPRTAATPMTPYLNAKGNNARSLIQMSAPPKQTHQGLFESNNKSSKRNQARHADGDEDDDDTDFTFAAATADQKGEMKKFAVKMNHTGLQGKNGASGAGRRRTLGTALGFKPVVGSPLRRE